MKKLLFVSFSLLLSFSALASSLELGVYVNTSVDRANYSPCAYLVTDQHVYNGRDGVTITFIHDPRVLPQETCKTNGFENYPIGVEVLGTKAFKDVRTGQTYEFYGTSLAL